MQSPMPISIGARTMDNRDCVDKNLFLADADGMDEWDIEEKKDEARGVLKSDFNAQSLRVSAASVRVDDLVAGRDVCLFKADT